jgi:phospholipase C
MPADTIGITKEEQAAIPIKHIIVSMKENRSYDHLFGQLSSHGQTASEAVPTDYEAQAGKPAHASTTCLGTDPPHDWSSMHGDVNGGKMDGFDSSSMGYYDDTDLPFYYWLANTFSIADRYFPSLLGGTVPNRVFSLFATSWGMKDNGDPKPPQSTPHILTLLDKKGIAWAVYADKGAFDNTLNGWPGVAEHKHSIAEFKTAAKNGTLPPFVWVDSIPGTEDEHPPSDVQKGEAWSRDIVQAVIASPLWPTTALLMTYDEGGGFFDHVPPPHTCTPKDGSPNEAAFFELGIRIPLIVASPWARRHFVSHLVHEHTSILRFVETVFDLPALTARDANSDALLDMFDFSCPSPDGWAAMPPAGSGGCK